MPTPVSAITLLLVGILCPAVPAQVVDARAQPAEPAPSFDPATAESIWPGIVRFYPSTNDKAKAPPSLIVQIPSSRFGPAPDQPPVIPKFSKEGDRHVATIEIEPGTSLYGAGVIPGPLTLNGRTFVASPAQRDAAPPAEPISTLAIPWIIAVRPDGTAFGVLADTTWRTEIDLATGIVFRADGPTLPIVVVNGAVPMEPVQALSLIAGWQEIPPIWALGLHIGPTEFIPDSDLGAPLGAMARSWRDAGLPVESVGVLWARMGEGENRVASLRTTASQLASNNVRLWAMLPPSLSKASAPALFEEGTPAGHWIKAAQGRPFELPMIREDARVFPDLTREATRAWWGRLYTSLLSAKLGALAFPFESPQTPALGAGCIPDDATHDADPAWGGPAPHAKYRGVYASLQARVAREAMKSAYPDRRPFVQISDPSVIAQRYGYQFIQASGGVIGVRSAIPTFLNLSMSGQAMAGIEISPGDRGPDGPELGRSLALAAMLPMIRLSAPDKSFVDPSSLTPETRSLCRQSLERRYRLIPYLYSLALDAYRTGQPVVRPYFMAAPADATARDVTDTFFLGQDLAVRLPPVENAPASPVPAGWRKFDFGEDSPLVPELYLRPGAVLPVGPAMLYLDEKPIDPLTLIVAPDAEGNAIGTLYEDEGDGFAYMQNMCRMAYYQAETKDGEMIVRMARLDGGMGMAKRKLTVRVLLADGREVSADYWDGLDVHIKLP